MAKYILPVLALFLIVGCQAPPPEQVQSVPLVELVNLHSMDIQESINISGQVSASAEVRVLAEIPGKISKLGVRTGDDVEKGDLIVRLDSSEQAIQLQQARATLEGMRAQLAEAEAGARYQDHTQAWAGVIQAESNYNKARDDLQRMEILYNGGIISRQELELAKQQYSIAKASLESARASQDKLREGPSEHTLQGLRAQVQQAQATVAAAQKQFEKTSIYAPISGKVAAVLAQEGELVGGGTAIYLLVDDDPVYVDIFVDEAQVSYLLSGQEAMVEVPAIIPVNNMVNEDGLLIGTIAELSPVAQDGSRSFQVRVEVANPEGLLQHGMFARVALQTRRLEDVTVVPASAVQQREGREYLFFYDNGMARAVEVKTGEQKENLIQVDGSLLSLPVIARPPRSLTDGDAVKTQEQNGLGLSYDTGEQDNGEDQAHSINNAQRSGDSRQEQTAKAGGLD